MEITYKTLKELHPYENNPRNNDEAVPKLINSIKEFGFLIPCVIDKNNVIVCGHTRYKAAKKLKMKTVPCVIADKLTPEQLKAFRLVDNKVAEYSSFDDELLRTELAGIANLDMSEFGFDNLINANDVGLTDTTYNNNVNIPQYEITGDCPILETLVNDDKVNSLLENIEKADIPEAEKDFLRKAATRHYAFNYKNVAEYYAHAKPEVQELMEESALVIIDYDNAIHNGYVQLSEDIQSLIESGEDE